MSYPTDFGAMARHIRGLQIAAFGDDPAAVMIQTLVLCEEAGEVARLAAKERQGIRSETRGDWAHELGDVLLVTFGLCAMHGLDPEDLIRSAVGRLERRAAKVAQEVPDAR